jgi:hypothetical protein
MLVDGNNFISHHLKNDKLFAAGKIGITEGKILYFYLVHNLIDAPSLKEGYIHSGIFPETEETVKYFCDVYLSSIKSLDLAPQWCQCILPFEQELYNIHNPKCYNTRLQDLEPYYFDSPWSHHLQDKKILVISPFAKSIEYQYLNFDNIWSGYLKKNFELEVLKFPFCIGLTNDGEMAKYSTYKNCLEHFKNEVSKKEFDFCIIGAGAYALPLCSFIKDTMKKSCLHLGGATQILFGILGNRWKNNPDILKKVNSFWKPPFPEEIPVNCKLMEEGCYW